jgi:cytochrome subunit of sulfide dehydrogenase
MKRVRYGLVLAMLGTPALFSHAQAPDPLQVRSWAGGCANCHGTSGNAEPGTVVLAGMNASELVRKMSDFKSGRQPATVMHQLSKGYTDEQIAAIAGWFAAQKK